MSSEKKILNKIVLGAGITTLGLFISKFLSYLYRLVVARIGPDAYGQISLGLAVVGLTSTFVALGLNKAIKKYVPEAREADDKAMLKGLVHGALKLIVPAGIIMGIIVFFSADLIAERVFNSPETAPIIRIFAFVPLFNKTTTVFTDYTIGHNTTKYRVALRRVLQNVLQISATLILIWMGYGVIGAAFGWLIGTILIMIISIYIVERDFGPLLTSDIKPKKMYPKMIKYSYPLIFASAIGTALGWGDTALLGYFMDDASVGFYNAAYPTAVLISIPASAVGSLALSGFSTLGAKGEGQSAALKTTTRWVMAMAFPAFILMALFSDQLLHLMFGTEYAVAGTALMILAFGKFFAASTGQLGAYLKSNGYTKIIFWNTTANFFLNIGLNIILIPMYGIVGAAIATASSIIFVNTLLLLEVYRFDDTHPFNSRMIYTVPAVLAALIPTYMIFKQAFTYTPYWALIPAGILFMTIYTLVFLKIGGLTHYDKEIILSGARKAELEEEAKKVLNILT